MVKVSIIVPFYNCDKYVNDCIDSLIGQTLEEIEIIAVNDGSQDNTSALLHAYEAKYGHKLKVIDIENQGCGNARNVGMSLAQGKYIGFVDGDDWVFPEMYEKLYTHAEEKSSDLVICNFIRCRNKTDIFPHEIMAFPDGFPRDKNSMIVGLHSSCAPCNKLYLREMLIKAKLSFPLMPYEDMGFTPAAITWATNPSYICEPLYYYRDTPDSVTNSKTNYIKTKGYLQALQYAIDQHNSEFSEPFFALIASLCEKSVQVFPYYHFEMTNFARPLMSIFWDNIYLNRNTYEKLVERMKEDEKTTPRCVTIFTTMEAYDEVTLNQLVDTYRKICNGFEVNIFGRSEAENIKHPLVKAALQKGDWKTVTDLCKLVVLITKGGICVDPEIMPLWGFAHLSFHKQVIGTAMNDRPHTHVMVSQRNSTFFTNILTTYIQDRYPAGTSLEERIFDYMRFMGYNYKNISAAKNQEITLMPSNYLLTDLDPTHAYCYYNGTDEALKEAYYRDTLVSIQNQLAKLNTVEKELEATKRELTKLFQSKSWKMTAPLRGFIRRYKALSKKRK